MASDPTGGPLSLLESQLIALGNDRAQARLQKCEEVYGSTQPTKQQVLVHLQMQSKRFGHRLTDLAQQGRDELLSFALVCGYCCCSALYSSTCARH